MEAGEWIAIGVAGLTLAIELMRIRREKARAAASERRLDEAESRLDAQAEAQALLELQVGLRELYQDALALLRAGDGGYATEASLSGRLVETERLAEQVKGEAGTATTFFVKRCGEILGWIERGTDAQQRESLRAGVHDAFEGAMGAVTARRAELRG